LKLKFKTAVHSKQTKFKFCFNIAQFSSLFSMLMFSLFFRYAILTPETWPQWRGDERQGIKHLMTCVKMEPDQWQCGATKLFVKNPESVCAFVILTDSFPPRIYPSNFSYFSYFSWKKVASENSILLPE